MDTNILKTANILLVEDEKDVREFTTTTLKNIVGDIIEAENGLDGLEKFKASIDDNNQSTFDAIVTDINMPKMDGLEMIGKIREIDGSIPIIITTAHNDAGFLKKAIDYGVGGYGMKPVDLLGLVKTLNRIIEPGYLRKNLQLEVNIKTQEIRSILDSQENIIILTDGENILESNSTLLEFFGINSIKDFIAQTPCLCERFIEEDGYFHLGLIDDNQIWLEEIQKLDEIDRIVKIKSINNGMRIFSVSINTYGDNNKHYVISLSDITALKEKAQLLEYQATHDNLTKLYNRQRFNDLLDYELKRNTRTLNEGLALIMLDIDHFKNVNDTYGHDVGDEVLINISNILTTTAKRDTDMVCRWGGEEFLILLSCIPNEEVMYLTEKIRKAVEDYKFDTVGTITISLGLTYVTEEDNRETLLKRVDNALYEAKNNGRNTIITL